MKLNFEDLMNYADAPEFKPDSISPATVERICDMTMKKIKPQKKRKLRPMGFLIAAVILVMLFCGTAFAAFQSGWFELLLGKNGPELEEHIIVYSPAPSNTASPEPTEPLAEESVTESTNTDSQKAAATYTAETTDYRFTLESMLAGTQTVHAVIRMEPLTDFGRSNMGLTIEDTFYPVLACCNGTGGSLSFELLSSSADCCYYLLTQTGGSNAIGDTVHFELLSILDENGVEHSASLFEVPITDIVDDYQEITLNKSQHDHNFYGYDLLTITPMSMTISGWFDHAVWEAADIYLENGAIQNPLGEPEPPTITITLTDGTSFDCSERTEYGNYGILQQDMSSDRDTNTHQVTYTFSKTIDLLEIAEICIDGISYTLDME